MTDPRKIIHLVKLPKQYYISFGLIIFTDPGSPGQY